MDRRVFLKRTAAASAATAVFGQGFLQRALAAPAVPGPGAYGPLMPIADANGLFLPYGFGSRIVGVSGQAVAGTSYTWHPAPDGGATFAHADGSWTYCSNSEVGDGGVGSITFGPDGAITGARRILTGTSGNCAGGPSTWGTWLSCEEHEQGYIWDCEPLGARAGIRLDALGQRTHEACAVDAVGKWIYTTEDDGSSRFYRFTPNEWIDERPNFEAGGTLEALQADLAAAVNGPTPVTWVPVADISQGYRGADSASFNRGEGCWIHGQTVYFCSTGDSRVWAVNGVTQTLEVVYLGGTGALQDADNITVHHQSGDLFAAEDAGNMELVFIGERTDGSGVREVTPFLRFATPGGDGSEVAGPAFSPDGTRLYVSSQRGRLGNPGGGGNGVTYEITGPFRGTNGQPQDPPPGLPTVLVPHESTWRILDDGSNQTPGFAAPSFDDSAWKQQAITSGLVLGYGGDDIVQPELSFGPDPLNKYITTYFRQTFEVADPSQFQSVVVNLIRDDGAAVYLNGVEIVRDNLPAGPLEHLTLAPVNTPDERTELAFSRPNTLVAGTNVIAVELHQTAASSSDLGFSLSLYGSPDPVIVPPAEPVAILPYELTWKILDDGSNQTPGFAAPAFDDSAWKQQAITPGLVLGYGDSDVVQPPLSFGPDSGNKYITTYFRHTFDVVDPTQFEELVISLVRDDGAAIYLNGVEVWRNNIPAGELTHTTLADDAGSERGVNTEHVPNTLVAGTNVLAVEVHQSSTGSSDLGFKLALAGVPKSGPDPVVPEISVPLLLGATGAATIGALAFLNRRRNEVQAGDAMA